MISSSPVVFTLPLLPASTRLLVDPLTQIAILAPGGDTLAPFRLYHLSPSACTILLALLETYPSFCSYQHLFAALYPLSRQGAPEVWSRKLALRPICRALSPCSMSWACGSWRCGGKAIPWPRFEMRLRQRAPHQEARENRGGEGSFVALVVGVDVLPCPFKL